jgi:hypothetical protein
MELYKDSLNTDLVPQLKKLIASGCLGSKSDQLAYGWFWVHILWPTVYTYSCRALRQFNTLSSEIINQRRQSV